MNRKRSLGILIATVLLLFAAAGTSFAERIIYVDEDAPGANDGSSWGNAYKYLQDALADANSSPKPIEVRVAKGTYKPDKDTLHPHGTGNRDASFHLINGVTIEGGYAGFGGRNPNARDLDKYETVLSGDLNGDDTPDFSNSQDNSYHVATGSGCDDTAVLDGFTVFGGNADHSPSPGNIGGGMLNHIGSPTVLSCVFVANYSVSGGGMYNWEGSKVRLIDCSFMGNSASGFGGGMYNNSSAPELVNCVFSNNSAGSDGGGMRNRSRSNPILNSCTFSSNTAKRGGAIANYEDSSPSLANCTLSENRADYGGGMHNSDNASPVLRNCRFSENSAWGGGGMYNDGGSPILRSCLFIGNSAVGKYGDGGGMHNNESSPVLASCAFSGNSADRYGGAMNIYRYATPTIKDCILWGDTPEELYVYGRAPVVTYSDIQGGWPGVGNIDTHPCFVDPGYWDTNGTPDDRTDDFWVDGDYHLLPDSPCINAGDPDFVGGPNETDIDGEARVMLGRVDMGADEFNPFAAEFVVVHKERVERTVFEYECEVVLENISRFAVKNVWLEMAKASANMTMIDSEVSFSDAEIAAGASGRSIDTCTFQVDRAEAIDPAGIIWRVTAELADTGAKMEHTLASMPPVGPPETGFEYLARLAEQWLWVGTPGGIEEDTIPDGTVNLADFAQFVENWKK